MVSAYDTGGVVEFAIADGLMTAGGTRYLRMGAIITKAQETDPLDGPVAWAFEAAFALNAPQLPSRAVAG
jgi:hypothetical protein